MQIMCNWWLLSVTQVTREANMFFKWYTELGVLGILYLKSLKGNPTAVDQTEQKRAEQCIEKNYWPWFIDSVIVLHTCLLNYFAEGKILDQRIARGESFHYTLFMLSLLIRKLMIFEKTTKYTLFSILEVHRPWH